MKNFDPCAAMASIRHEFGEHGGVNMSIEASTTFTVMHAETMPEIFSGHVGPETGGCYLYGRHFNPTVFNLGRQLAAMEGAESGYCTSSGMAAIASSLLQVCSHGDHVVASNTLYGGTYALLKDYLPRISGIRTQFVDIRNPENIRAAITNRTKAIYVESLANPTLVCADIPQIAAVAKEFGLKLIVDNTFTPMIFSPLKLGADIVVHSLTKYINGASDIIGGAILGSKEFIGSLMDLHQGSLMLLGPTMDPEVAFRVHMRLPHLAIRMKEHASRAMYFAERLSARGLNVIYPGLKRHPQHELFQALSHPEFGFGGIFALDAGTEARANQLMEHLQLEAGFGFIAVSLGYFETLMSCSGSSTSSELSEEEKRMSGITPGLIRFSIGLTGAVEQRWEQMERGLQAIGL
ncbi:MAG: aminotransferase class I/II-fold pyridoxal phosphate-dependent enzyme [Acidobacteria bacterium]|nr:aminotransferase class I/II-fold pyridoxal phosphate-dependent enzyme [Acidobacteriota bacterium]